MVLKDLSEENERLAITIALSTKQNKNSCKTIRPLKMTINKRHLRLVSE